MYYQQLVAESKRLEAQIKQLQTELERYPEGKLQCRPNGKYQKWFVNDGHNIIYIPRKKHHLLTKYATHEYLSCSIDDLINQKQLIDSYLFSYSKRISKTDKFLSKHPQVVQFLQPYFSESQNHPAQIKTWLNTPFESNPSHPEHLIHNCPSGHKVRSKSEAIIAASLYSYKIPFKYECPLFLDDMVYYPDFTIMHPLTLSIYYWEHFGLMDESSYIDTATKKIHKYALNGILPNINLIITCETKTSPLDFIAVSSIIHSILLKKV